MAAESSSVAGHRTFWEIFGMWTHYAPGKPLPFAPATLDCPSATPGISRSFPLAAAEPGLKGKLEPAPPDSFDRATGPTCVRKPVKINDTDKMTRDDPDVMTLSFHWICSIDPAL